MRGTAADRPALACRLRGHRWAFTEGWDLFCIRPSCDFTRTVSAETVARQWALRMLVVAWFVVVAVVLAVCALTSSAPRLPLLGAAAVAVLLAVVIAPPRLPRIPGGLR